MTKTAFQLLWDKEFIEKRIHEQMDYMLEIMNRPCHYETIYRRVELMESASAVLSRLNRQLWEIEKLK